MGLDLVYPVSLEIAFIGKNFFLATICSCEIASKYSANSEMMSNSSTVIEDFCLLELEHTQVLMGASEREQNYCLLQELMKLDRFFSKKGYLVCVSGMQSVVGLNAAQKQVEN